MYLPALNTSRALGLTLAGLLLCAGLALAGTPLSTEVARLIESQGVDAARKHFAELWDNSTPDTEYDPDVDGLADLGTRYLQEGNIEAGMAVMEMVSIISLAELDSALQSQAALMAEMEAAAAEIAAETGAEAPSTDEGPQPAAADHDRTQTIAADHGPARTDLERLTGIYASEEAPRRELFVTRTCDGFLVAGPLWADTAPWNLRSESMQVFTFQQGDLHFRIEFSTDGDDAAQQLTHSIRGLASPMQRRGPLPGDWPDCQPTT